MLFVVVGVKHKLAILQASQASKTKLGVKTSKTIAIKHVAMSKWSYRVHISDYYKLYINNNINNTLYSISI